MLIVLSPAKTLDFDTTPSTQEFTQPALLEASEKLVGHMKKMSETKLSSLMSISDALAQLNVERFQAWGIKSDLTTGKQAILAFKGDVYQGMDAESFSADELAFAQQHIRILSGLYGLLRPLDAIRPYRLEMGTKIAMGGHKTLYSFWGSTISKQLNLAMETHPSKVLVNLASNEYFKAIKTDVLTTEVITPVFKESKNGKYQTIGVFAKKARGRMAAFAVKNACIDAEGLKAFNEDGYIYRDDLSTDRTWIFAR